jgi:DNA-binding transcriptional ArsR family regulator
MILLMVPARPLYHYRAAIFYKIIRFARRMTGGIIIWMENSKDFKKLGKELEIFANEHRLAILNCLKKRKSRSVGGISDDTSISFKIVSKHLLYLARKGILTRRYDGQFVIYKISDNLPKTARMIISSL